MIINDMREGLRHILGSRVLVYLLLLTAVATAGWAASDVALVAYVNENLDLGGREYGLLRGLNALSLTIGVYVIGRFSKRLSRRKLLLGGVLLVGAVLMSVIVQPVFILLMVLWFIKGFGWSGHWLMDNAYWADATSDEARGRVFSQAWAIIALVETLVALLAGWLTIRIGPSNAMAFLGGIMFFGTLVLSFTTRGYQALTTFDKRNGVSERLESRLEQRFE
jgi:MFS family permease